MIVRDIGRSGNMFVINTEGIARLANILCRWWMLTESLVMASPPTFAALEVLDEVRAPRPLASLIHVSYSPLRFPPPLIVVIYTLV